MSAFLFFLFLFFVCLFVYFLATKIAFKSFLDLHFHPSIIEIRIGGKIHTKAVVDERLGKVLVGTFCAYCFK